MKHISFSYEENRENSALAEMRNLIGYVPQEPYVHRSSTIAMADEVVMVG